MYSSLGEYNKISMVTFCPEILFLASKLDCSFFSFCMEKKSDSHILKPCILIYTYKIDTMLAPDRKTHYC